MVIHKRISNDQLQTICNQTCQPYDSTNHNDWVTCPQCGKILNVDIEKNKLNYERKSV